MFGKSTAKRIPGALERSPAVALLPTAAAKSGVPSIVSADMQIDGNIRSSGEVHIDGTVRGDVAAKIVTLGETAVVEGQITGDSVRICGVVTGRIAARDVVLVRSAVVRGDVEHEVLAIEAGAQIEGHCRRLQSKAANGVAAPVISVLKDEKGAELVAATH